MVDGSGLGDGGIDGGSAFIKKGLRRDGLIVFGFVRQGEQGQAGNQGQQPEI